MATTFKFKLLAGTHDVGSGDDRRTFKAGEEGNNIVESDKPLDKLFKNKFERIGEVTKKPRDHDNTLDTSGRQGDDPEHIKAKTRKVAPRTQAELEEESPKPARRKVAAAEYEEDYDASVKKAVRGKTRGGDDAEDAEDAEVQGDDVTEEFEGAADAGLTVHKDAKAKVFRIARGGKQIGDDHPNKTAAKKALKAEIDSPSGDEDADEADADEE